MHRIVLDTETLGNVNQPESVRVYDFAFVVIDEKFNVVKSYRAIVAETWRGDFGNMSSAYYAYKLTDYHAQLLENKLEVKPMLEIWQDFKAICEEYKINEIWAYNAAFDRNALNVTIEKCSNGFRSFFAPYGVKWYCIQHVTAQTIMNTKRFFKFVMVNNLTTGKGNPKTSAEAAYAFITINPHYSECHTALEDSLIEAQILKACYSNARGQWRKIDKKPNRQAWRIVKDNYQKWLEK